MVEEEINKITEISETLLVPLYARAIETQSKNPIIIDRKAVEITKKLNNFFSKSNSKLHMQLAKGKIKKYTSKKLATFLSMRSRKFDAYCQDFLKHNPGGTIVELGCGLSSRFSRIDNKTVEWYDLDLPEVIETRKQFFVETTRYHMISSSVLDFKWMNQIPAKNVLFIAEGVLMYLHEGDVKSLILKLKQNFPGCELVCEMENSFIINALKKKRWRKKFQADHNFSAGVSMYFGIRNGNDIEKWGEGISFLDEWTLFDDHEKKLGWLNLFSFSKKLRKAQWVVHYQLGKPLS